MDEKEVRRIVVEEIIKNYRSGNPIVAPHKHNGTDNLRIRQSDIIPLIAGNGTIDMFQSTTYKLKLGNYGITPRSVTFYGGAYNITDTPHIHAMVTGSAQLGNNQQFQPESSTSVIIGPTINTIIQGSAAIVSVNSSLTFDGAGAKTGGSNSNSYLVNSEGHILYVDSGATLPILAQADVVSFDRSVIEIQTSLAANWKISGLWIVS